MKTNLEVIQGNSRLNWLFALVDMITIRLIFGGKNVEKRA